MAKYNIIKKLKCPKCSDKNPLIIDYYEGHSVTFSYDKTSKKYDEGLLEHGEVTKVLAKCENCSHCWKLRGMNTADDLLDFESYA